MILYDARPVRLAGQVLIDVLVIAAGVAAVVLGRALTASICGLADIGARVHAEGAAFQEQLLRTAKALGEIPFAGDAVSAPLRQAGKNAGAIADAGTQQHDATVQLAHLVGGSVMGILLLVLLLTWVRYRGRFIRTATATNRVGRTPAGTELLAVRALQRNAAAALGADVVDRWRRGDAATQRRSSRLRTWNAASAGCSSVGRPVCEDQLARMCGRRGGAACGRVVVGHRCGRRQRCGVRPIRGRAGDALTFGMVGARGR